MKEPLFNTWSNLAYLPASVFVVLVGIAHPWVAFNTASGLLLLFMGSSIFHFQRKPDGSQGTLGVLGWKGGHVDELGMYWVFTGLVLSGLVQRGILPDIVGAGLLLAAAVLYALTIKHLQSSMVLGILSLPLMVMLYMVSPWHLLITLGIAALAFAFRTDGTSLAAILNFKGTHSGYTTWKHGLWHVLTAAMIAFIAYSLTLPVR